MNIDRGEPKNISRRKAMILGSSAMTASCVISNADNHEIKKSEIVRPPTGKDILLSVKLGMIAKKLNGQDLTLTQRLQMAADAGLDGVDFDEAGAHTEEAARMAVQESGVFVHNAINHAHWGKRLTSPNKTDRETAKNNIKHCIRVSHAAGGNGVLIVVGAGGHTVEDSEPKFGLAVTGIVHPEKIWRNVGALPGDELILTKPIGSGVLFNAKLKDKVSKNAFDSCIGNVTTLNKQAAEIFLSYDVHAATDITGFGLAGHGLEMAQGSDASLHINLDAVPVMDEAYKMYELGISTGVNKHNRAKVMPSIHFSDSAKTEKREILFDPQTSGGLLVSLPKEQAKDCLLYTSPSPRDS